MQFFPIGNAFYILGLPNCMPLSEPPLVDSFRRRKGLSYCLVCIRSSRAPRQRHAVPAMRSIAKSDDLGWGHPSLRQEEPPSFNPAANAHGQAIGTQTGHKTNPWTTDIS